MITNSKLTVYHKSFNNITRLEEWTRYNYDNVWVFKSDGSSINKGIEESNNLQVRIPYTNDIDTSKFSLGDIVVCDEVSDEIEKQQDLDYEVFNITNINDNYFGNNPHVHLGCK